MPPPFADNPILLSEPERDALQSWVDAARSSLALSDWSIKVTQHAANGASKASSFIEDQADESVIALGVAFRERSAEELRHDLTHELLHPHFQRITRLAEKLIDFELGRRTEAVIRAAVEEVEEQTIDRLAGAIARFLPLPELPQEDTHG